MVSCLTDIKHGIKVGSLSGRSKDRCNAPFQIRDLSRNHIIGRILASCIKISIVLQIEKTSHFLCGVIFKCSTLNDRHHSGLAFFRLPAGLDTFCFNMIFLAHFVPLHSVYILKTILPLFYLQGYLKII